MMCVTFSVGFSSVVAAASASLCDMCVSELLVLSPPSAGTL